MTPLSTLILSGGNSSRMGQDKACLLRQGVPLLRYLIDQVLPLSTQVAVITPWPERYQAMIPASCRLISELRLHSTAPGPLVAFEQGLAEIQTDWVFLLACDLPFLTTAILANWMDQLPHVNDDAIALLAKHPKGWEPLCGFYRTSCRDLLRLYLAQGGRSFQGWLAQESVQALTVRDPAALLNCNTPEEWQAAGFTTGTPTGLQEPFRKLETTE